MSRSVELFAKIGSAETSVIDDLLHPNQLTRMMPATKGLQKLPESFSIIQTHYTHTEKGHTVQYFEDFERGIKMASTRERWGTPFKGFWWFVGLESHVFLSYQEMRDYVNDLLSYYDDHPDRRN